MLLRFIAFAALASPAASALAQGTIYNLGPSNAVSGLSADGLTAAGTNLTTYFRWTASGGLVPIGGSAPGNGIGGQARISDDGSRICGSFLNPVSGANEMSLYTTSSGSWTPLGGIGGQSGTEISGGWGISGDGNTVVGLGWVNAGSAHAIRWKQGGATVDLGSTVPNRSTRANGANQNGNVIVGWQDSTTGFRQGAIWTSGVQTLLTLGIGGAQLGEAQDCSADGSVVVGTGVSATNFAGYKWTPGTGGVSLGKINATWRGAATAVSDDGSVIVGFERPFPGPATFGIGLIWVDGQGPFNLNTYLTNLGFNIPAGTTFALPLAISADGNTIAGLGRQSSPPGEFGFVIRTHSIKGNSVYGTGSAGCSGVQTLSVGSVPEVNNSSFGFTCDNAPASSIGIGLITDAQDLGGTDIFGVGILVHVGILTATEVITVDLFSDPSGSSFAPAPIPNDPLLAGKVYFGQGIWFWNGACALPSPYSLSSTRGLKLTIQP